MPVPLTYPGVYIEEIPSGVRTISGVATSITAFIGRAPRGPVDQPTPINNVGDFERAFGGLDSNYPMGFAVRQFYQNGGSRALIVRVWVAPPAPPAPPAPAANPNGVATATVGGVGGLNLVASSPGEWGNRLSVEVNRDGLTDAAAQALGYPNATAVFNLTIQLDRPNGPRETFLGVSVVDGPRRVDRILEQSSQFVRVPNNADGSPNLPASPPANTPDGTPTPLTGGGDSVPLESNGYLGSEDAKTGLYALERADLFNLLCIPPDTLGRDTPPGVYGTALTYCRDRRAMLLVDPPADWNDNTDFNAALTALNLPRPSG